MVKAYKTIEKALSDDYLLIRGLPTETIKKRQEQGKEAFLLVQDKETKRFFKVILKEK